MLRLRDCTEGTEMVPVLIQHTLDNIQPLHCCSTGVQRCLFSSSTRWTTYSPCTVAPLVFSGACSHPAHAGQHTAPALLLHWCSAVPVLIQHTLDNMQPLHCCSTGVQRCLFSSSPRWTTCTY
ncbi:hypothetical protein ACOMHN_006665 [Nucella lapillus]